MKNNKGFTLVELLAVISIVAIMVIIAVPNVLKMFNDSKKSSFETELKNIYSAAEKEYVNDSLSSSGNKTYAFCKNGNCGKGLKLNGGKDMEYYIEFDSSGKVTKYYATNGSYQYRYNGPGLKITDINNAEFIPDLSEDNVIVISDSASPNNPVCSSKFVTTIGSFDYNSDVKELCVDIVDDGYTFEFTDYGSYATSGNAYVSVKWFDKFTDSTYIRVYEDSTKSKLLKEITKADFPFDRYSISNNYFNDYVTYYQNVFPLGEYEENHAFYVEASSDVTNGYNDDNKPYYFLGYTTGYRTISGGNKWITDQNTIRSLKTLEESAQRIDNGLDLFGFTNCPIDNNNIIIDNYENDCGGNTYNAIIQPGLR